MIALKLEGWDSNGFIPLTFLKPHYWDDWYDPNSGSIMSPEISEECKRWKTESGVGDFFVIFNFAYLELTFAAANDEDAQPPVSVQFENEKDLIHFKLRWL